MPKMVDITKAYDFTKARVICDESNNTPNQVATGKVLIYIEVPQILGGHRVLSIPHYEERFIDEEKIRLY